MINKHALISLTLLTLLMMVLAGCSAETPLSPTSTPVPPTPTQIPPANTPTPVPAPTAVPEPTDTPAPTTPDSALVEIPALTKNLPYTISLAPAVLAQKLDVYTPGREQENGWPVVVLAHGFMQGKRDFKILSEKIAEQGAVVFTVNWPTYTGESTQRGNGQQIREMSETLVCAVRYADAHATAYGGNPDRIIYTGFSLGAGMGGLISLAGETLEEGWKTLAENSGEPIDPIDCVATEGSAKVEAFIGIAGPYGMFDENRDENPDRWALISPSEQIGSNPDLLVRLLHGEIDASVPVEASQAFKDALSAADYDATLTLFEDGHKVPHDLTLATIADLVEKLSPE